MPLSEKERERCTVPGSAPLSRARPSGGLRAVPIDGLPRRACVRDARVFNVVERSALRRRESSTCCVSISRDAVGEKFRSIQFNLVLIKNQINEYRYVNKKKYTVVFFEKNWN